MSGAHPLGVVTSRLIHTRAHARPHTQRRKERLCARERESATPHIRTGARAGTHTHTHTRARARAHTHLTHTAGWNRRLTGSGPPPDWERQLAAVTSVLENLQATLSSSTVLDAASTSELKQQQLNLKLKAKVREQKLQKQVEELEEELAAARKSAEVRP